jgi:predicted ester cyclase
VISARFVTLSATNCTQFADELDSRDRRTIFEACETGEGWQGCEQYCHPGATFASQTDALADVTTLEAYTEWMKGLMAILPDGNAEVRSLAVDETRHNVAAFGVFRATHTGEGGPVPPTDKSAEADYVYVMDFDGDKIRHMTKIWNDGLTMRQLGWA